MLNDVEFKMSYSSGYDAPKEFFTEALIESKYFDLGLGFFSSSGIRSLAYGFAIFIANGGTMRVIINHILSKEDKESIENGLNAKQIDFEGKIIANFDRLVSVLSKADEHFFRCLSYLISTNRIEFVATISPQGGIGHDKYGIFTDEIGNKVAFIGSANFSSTALELNGETITVFTSDADKSRVDFQQNLFDNSWLGDNNHLIHVPIERIKTHIQGKFNVETINELLQEGASIREINDIEKDIVPNKDNQLSPNLLEKIRVKEREPRFPFPEEREIQKDAYKAWIDNGRRGIFAMATGTGKTVTALNCVLKEYKKNGFYKAVIVVPTRALAEQWEREASAFNFQNIISTQTNTEWRYILSRYTTQSLRGINKNIILITTYATFNRNNIQTFLKDTKRIESFVYIADEAHNLGSPSSLQHLPHMISNRIGLSATPERIYDDFGSKEIYNFFNSAPPEYTYRYTMKQAIWQEPNILCHYEYYPIFVKLTTDEMEEYRRITGQLRGFIDAKTGLYRKEEAADKLLLKRKRVVHKAKNKQAAIASLLDEMDASGKLKYAFVFVPEGYEPDYSNQDSNDIDTEDIHIIDEYASLFKNRGYTYHKYITGIEDAPTILQNFADGRIHVLLSMKCLDEGVDIPRAEYAIFCASTGNPRQFVQRRGRVLRKNKYKEIAKIWDLIVIPPEVPQDSQTVEKNMFTGEVRRIVNFAVLADNRDHLLNGELMNICEELEIPIKDIVEAEDNQY